MNTHAGRKLGRPTGARFAMIRNQAASLLKHEQIRTTYAKAREVSRFTDGIIAAAKKKTLPSLRVVAAAIPDRDIRKKIYDVLVPRYQARPGGMTRVLRLGARDGDNAQMAVVKLVS
jgi:large subunit ribosomal protein L17